MLLLKANKITFILAEIKIHIFLSIREADAHLAQNKDRKTKSVFQLKNSFLSQKTH